MPEGVQFYAIPEAVYKATLTLLGELPMTRVRSLVEALEAAQPVVLGGKDDSTVPE